MDYGTKLLKEVLFDVSQMSIEDYKNLQKGLKQTAKEAKINMLKALVAHIEAGT